jgi:UDP-glucose:(heptosyl)LPS alpha-1,3-glucosyltransferase
LKEITFIRANKTKFGGAENYLTRLSNELEAHNIRHSLRHSKISKLLPSWFRVILFNLQVCFKKKNDFYFSLERITCPDIYRAGDGVHKVFLQSIKKSRLNPLHPIYLYLEKKCFNNAKYIIANSKMIKNQIIDTYNIDENKIKVVYNGVNLNLVADSKRLKKEFNLRNEQILLYVGSGFERKGVKEFLHLVAKIKTKNIKAFVVGKEKKINVYKNIARDLKIENSVIFTGARSDVNDFYDLSDIFIFPTHYEPFSNVVLEAMSFNNAIFTTKQNGASEILNDDFIMQNPSDNVGVKIDDLLKNPVKLQQIKNDNYKKVQDFSIENNATNTLKIINKL